MLAVEMVTARVEKGGKEGEVRNLAVEVCQHSQRLGIDSTWILHKNLII